MNVSGVARRPGWPLLPERDDEFFAGPWAFPFAVARTAAEPDLREVVLLAMP